MCFKDLKIIFLGTPEFAVASLNALIQAGYNMVGVVTAPDKPAGRGMKLHESAVKKYAVEKGLNILQPQKLKDPEFLAALRSLNANLQIVVAFRMLPEVVWNMPPMGTINLHSSLLPRYRGAAPINWAIINGEKETGVTTFKLKHEIDTGDILLQQRISIGENETAGELHDRMKEIGAQLLVRTIKELADGTLKEISQSSIVNSKWSIVNSEKSKEGHRPSATHSPFSIHHSPFTIHHSPKHAPKIFTDTCKIDWTRPVNEIHNLIRGLSPHPGAFTIFNEKMLKIYRCEKELIPHTLQAGSLQTDKRSYLKYACYDGFIIVKEIQLEGKKKMMIEEFLRGYRI